MFPPFKNEKNDFVYGDYRKEKENLQVFAFGHWASEA
jgi:hypothetical protein